MNSYYYYSPAFPTYECMFIIVPQVYRRLQKLNLVMSHQVTIRLVNELGVDHDRKVKEWRDALTSCLPTAGTQVKAIIIQQLCVTYPYFQMH